MMPEPEPELIERCLRGDEDAWWELFFRLDGYVTQTIARDFLRASAADVADIRQEVFVRLIRSLGNLRPQSGRFWSWLRTVVLNTGLDFARRRSSQKQAPLSSAVDDFEGLEEIPDSSPDPAEVAMLADEEASRDRGFKLALHLSAPKTRAVGEALLRGWSQRQIARHLNVSESHVSRESAEFVRKAREVFDRTSPEDLPDVERTVIARELAREESVRESVVLLSPKLKEVALLIARGLSEGEISQLLKLPIGTVRSRRDAISRQIPIGTLFGARCLESALSSTG